MSDEKQEIVIPKRWSGHYDLEQTILKMKQKSGGDDPDDRGIVQSVTVELIEELGTAEADLAKSKQAFEDLRIADQATLTETLAAALEQSMRAEKAEAERDAAIELAAWISVKDCLPYVGKRVLVVIGGIVQFNSFVFHGNGWGWDDDSDDAPLEIVSHWQTLPEFPVAPSIVADGEMP